MNYQSIIETQLAEYAQKHPAPHAVGAICQDGELLAAAELVRLNYGRPGCDPDDVDRAALQLADAYLADRHADDAEGVTVEWLKSVGFAFRPDIYGGSDWWEVGNAAEVQPQTVSYYPGTETWYYGCCGLVPLTTRGDVRRLLAALKVAPPAEKRVPLPEERVVVTRG